MYTYIVCFLHTHNAGFEAITQVIAIAEQITPEIETTTRICLLRCERTKITMTIMGIMSYDNRIQDYGSICFIILVRTLAAQSVVKIIITLTTDPLCLNPT